MRGDVKISDEVISVLRQARLEGDNLFLTTQLDRSMYIQVNKVLQPLGFTWKHSKACHVGTAGAATRLAEALKDKKTVDKKKKLQAFFTPPDLARRLVEFARIKPGMRILEPSVGDGALVQAALDLKLEDCSFFMVDIEPQREPALKALIESNPLAKFDYLIEDFCAVDPSTVGGQFDRVLINPPFGDGLADRHLLHARRFVKPGGQMWAILPANWQNSRRPKAMQEPISQLMQGAGIPACFFTTTNQSFKSAGPDRPFKAVGTSIEVVIACFYL